MSADTDVTVRRGYTECRFGQMHFIEGLPAATTALKTPLILLHQNPSSSMEYRFLLKEMAKDRRVIAFDTPGNGMSDRPPEAQSVPGYAAAFADALTALGFGDGGAGKVDLFGFHSGTYYVSELAASRPDLVRRPVMSGIPFRPHDERQTRLETAKNPPPLTEDGSTVFAQFKWMWDFIVVNRDPKMPLERAAEIYMENIKPMQRSSWPYVGVWSYPAEDRLPAITQPTLVIAVNDVTFANTIRAAKLIPHVTLIEFADLVASVFDVAPDRYAAALREFLV
jgi:pimeloyl-ACP methyl ester carboxylesterase